MSRFEGNPFDEDSSTNPYSTGESVSRSQRPGPAATGSYFDTAADSSLMRGGSTTSIPLDDHLPSLHMKPLPPESRAGSAFDAAGDIPFSPTSLKRKQKELMSREAQLRRKEQELANRETTLNLEKPNWPPFWPLIRHNIAADIPEHLRSMQRLAFFSWMGAITALFYNFLAITICWAMGALSFLWGMVSFFVAIVFLLLGVPLSYFLWYRRLYMSFKNDSSIGLVFFFISYISHNLWFLMFTIAPPIFFGGYFMTGVLTTLGMFAAGQGVGGAIYAVGTVLFGLEVTLSVVVLGQVFAYWRGAGKANQLKREAAMAALTNAV